MVSRPVNNGIETLNPELETLYTEYFFNDVNHRCGLRIVSFTV